MSVERDDHLCCESVHFCCEKLSTVCQTAFCRCFVPFMEKTQYYEPPEIEKGPAFYNKTLLREHYMKMKKLLSDLITLLK